VKVQKENLLPTSLELGATDDVLGFSLVLVFALGSHRAAMDCYENPPEYAAERIQIFGKPIGGFQLNKRNSQEMLTEIYQSTTIALESREKWWMKELPELYTSPWQSEIMWRMAINIARESIDKSKVEMGITENIRWCVHIEFGICVGTLQKAHTEIFIYWS